MVWTLDTKPVHLGGGTVARVMRDGEKLQVQLWSKPAAGWVPGGTTIENLRAIDMAPPVSPEWRARLGMPEED
jgi:hypothetical protein